MVDVIKVFFCALLAFCLVDIGYGLRCLSCHSTNVTSRCRQGSRSKSPKVETCYGRRAKCYAAAVVNEYGDASFQRGCSKLGICSDEDVDDLEFCLTCQYNNCNYEFMELAEEVEDYLLGSYVDSNESSTEIPEEPILSTNKEDTVEKVDKNRSNDETENIFNKETEKTDGSPALLLI